jgi:repressor of nif and glnA expression
MLVNVDNDTCAASEQPRGDQRRGAHRGLARARRQHHRDHHQQERAVVKALKNKAKEGELTPKEKKELTEEEKEYKSKRKLIQEKLIKFATRIPAFMYLTDFRENTLQDVITKLEPDLFRP